VPTKREPLSLSVDTTTEVRSVAVTAGARVLAQRAGHLRGAHTANLLGDIDAALKEAGVRLKDLDLFAAAKGPGSFTGLRAGLATIKAFAATLARPVVGVSTLHAVARAAGSAPAIVAALPAGRRELFAQLLSVAPDDTVTELSAPAHLPPDALCARALDWPPQLLWAGAGAQSQSELLRTAAARAGIAWRVEADDAPAEAGTFASERIAARACERVADAPRSWTLARAAGPYAVHVAALALKEFQSGRTVPAAELRAQYVRLSDAELNERWRG
jgi:tRNA threonylcarbamoyladenosine biosynthesis protein TsaB